MKLFFKFFSLLFFLTLTIFSPLFAKEYKEVYVIEVGKINIGSLFWNISLAENNYKISIKLENNKFLSHLYKFEGEYEAKGLIVNNALFPIKYNQTWLTKKKKTKVEMIFDKDSLIELKLSPEETEHARIKYIGIINHLDPLSSFLNILLGQEQSKTIDGRRIYTMQVSGKENTNNIKTKNILIQNYVNIWADHKKNDLKYIEVSQKLNEKSFKMPLVVKIKFKGILLKLNKI